MDEPRRDLYEVLGVARDAPADTLRKAYRKLARELHPDVNPGDEEAERRFKEVAGAYDVLSDEEKRKAYDEFGFDSLRSGFDPEKARAYQQWQQGRARTGHPFQDEVGGFGGFGGFGGAGDMGDLGDLFRTIRQQQAQRPRRGGDVHASLALDLPTAMTGTQVSVEVPATGGGSRSVQVRIPQGAEDGDTLRIRGKGAPGANGGPDGDLVIEVRVEEHPVFTRDGRDLRLELPITLHEAYTGAKVPVPTMDGEVSMKIPAGAQSGQTLRLKGKGVTRGKATGDLYVTLKVVVPPAGDDALATALEAAESLYDGNVRAGVKA
ncbi:MAG: molecular chaperone DnaJ [Sandaracinus sp.]|nr:molecular chaperone DnaJ [Sandaracinus sp.]